MRIRYLLSLLFLATCCAEAQAPQAALPTDLQAVVTRQFGKGVMVDTAFPTPLIVADLDNDGVEDAIIVALPKGLSPISPNYKMIDPYDEYFGYGDPRITSEFASADPTHRHALLIIHGKGPEGWRAAEPKAKFVVINLPFERLGVEEVRIKKKPVTAISAEDSSVLSSLVFWTGKKYRWEPNGLDE